MGRSVVAVFARYPEPGKVKTRLAAALGPEGACRLYVRMVRALLEEHRGREYDLVVYVTPSEKVDAFSREFSVPAVAQSGGDLGGRMADCFRALLECHERVVITGSDIPGLTANRISEAFAATDNADVVLGPSPDGGYYLIGSRRLPEVFADIPWSTGEVLSRTLDRLRSQGRSWHLLPPERDIDEPSDLAGRISVIVPVVDGDDVPPGAAEEFDECILVDGGGNGRARRNGVWVLHAPRGRAAQMNAGAEAATGDILVFLHADTVLPPRAADRIREAVRRGAPGGCFETIFDHRHPLFRVGDFWRNLRARTTGAFYGDQTIFVRRDVFDKLGGYRTLRAMEDYDFCRRLVRFGWPAYIPDRAVTSARKFLRHGIVRTWVRHQRIKLGYFLGRPTP